MRSSLARLFALATIMACSIAGCSDDPASSNASNPPQQGRDGGADSSIPPAPDGGSSTADLGAGPFTLAYAGTEVGIDMRPIAEGKASFEDGKLVKYEASEDERPELGTNQVSDAAGDTFVALGRWSGGTTAGKFYEIAGTGLIDLPANGGLHYAIGKFSDPLPATGSYTYSELAKTPATVSDGSAAPGTISGSVAVSFAGESTKIGFSLTIDVPGDTTYTIATTGGTADLSASEVELREGSVKGAFSANLDLTSGGAACEGSCAAVVDGFVVGPEGERIALVAHVFKGSGGAPKSVAAAIAFKR